MKMNSAIKQPFLRIELVVCIIVATCFASARSQEYEVSEIRNGPSKESVPAALAKGFESNGTRVTRESNKTVCDIWLRSPLEVVADFVESKDLLYPFKQGQLIGLIHFPRRTSEFRQQTMESGWYTLRFGLQPVDGNHVGTSPTRDFLLMVKAENDQIDKTWSVKDLLTASAEVAGSSHPAMMFLQRVDKTAESKSSIRHNEEKDWWTLRLVGKGNADGKSQDVVIDLIVVGHAAE